MLSGVSPRGQGRLLWKGVAGAAGVSTKVIEEWILSVHLEVEAERQQALPLSWLEDGNNRGRLFHFPKRTFSAYSGEELAAFFSPVITFSFFPTFEKVPAQSTPFAWERIPWLSLSFFLHGYPTVLHGSGSSCFPSWGSFGSTNSSLKYYFRRLRHRASGCITHFGGDDILLTWEHHVLLTCFLVNISLLPK